MTSSPLIVLLCLIVFIVSLVQLVDRWSSIVTRFQIIKCNILWWTLIVRIWKEETRAFVRRMIRNTRSLYRLRHLHGKINYQYQDGEEYPLGI